MRTLFSVAMASAFRGTLFAINSGIAPTEATKMNANGPSVRPRRSNVRVANVWPDQKSATASAIVRTAPTNSIAALRLLNQLERAT